MSDLAERLVRVQRDHRRRGHRCEGCDFVSQPRIDRFYDEDTKAAHETHLADALAAEVGRALEDKACAFCRGCHPADLDRCICGLWPVLRELRGSLGLTTTPASLAGRDEETK